MEEEFNKIEQKFVIQCKECGHKFLPWKALMVTLPTNNMRPYIYCPKCNNYDNLEKFYLTNHE